MTEFVSDKQIYTRVLIEELPKTKQFLWLATADLKDLHIKDGRRYKPLLEVIAEMLSTNIEVRLIHAKEPGPVFREEFDRFKVLSEKLERLLCQRVHFKTIIIDGRFAYTGSANLTGAGIGARSDNKRNFEAGIITDEKYMIDKIMDQYDSVWMGNFCPECKFLDRCPEKDQMS